MPVEFYDLMNPLNVSTGMRWNEFVAYVQAVLDGEEVS